MPTWASHAWSRLQSLNITYWAIIVAFLSKKLRVGSTTFFIKTWHAFLFSSKSTAGMTTGEHLSTGWSGELLALLLITNILQGPNSTSGVDLHHDISTIAALLHLSVSLKLLASFANVIRESVATLALLCFAANTAESIFGIVLCHFRSEWLVVGILDILQFALDKLELGLTFNAWDNIALLPNALVLEVAHAFFSN